MESRAATVPPAAGRRDDNSRVGGGQSKELVVEARPRRLGGEGKLGKATPLKG